MINFRILWSDWWSNKPNVWSFSEDNRLDRQNRRKSYDVFLNDFVTRSRSVLKEVGYISHYFPDYQTAMEQIAKRTFPGVGEHIVTFVFSKDRCHSLKNQFVWSEDHPVKTQNNAIVSEKICWRSISILLSSWSTKFQINRWLKSVQCNYRVE